MWYLLFQLHSRPPEGEIILIFQEAKASYIPLHRFEIKD